MAKTIKRKARTSAKSPRNRGNAPPKRGPGRPWTEDGRRENIPVRVNEKEKALIQAAAAMSETTVAAFMRTSTIEAARRVASRT